MSWAYGGFAGTTLGMSYNDYLAGNSWAGTLTPL